MIKFNLEKALSIKLKQDREKISGKKPNILIIWGDDVVQTNLSYYSMGLMGWTPNIDRIAKEGAVCTDYYGRQSFTAGRSSFITGQNIYRTGLYKEGTQVAQQGLQSTDVTIAQILKSMGYTTGQFGRDHLGDRNEFLPTVHGFDEFFGFIYHPDTEEEREDPHYTNEKDSPDFKKIFGLRGVLHCFATDKDDTSADPGFGKAGRQIIEDTGALTKKRMETIDDETCRVAMDFIIRAKKDNIPFFCWINTTNKHAFTQLKRDNKRHKGRWLSKNSETLQSNMMDHDKIVGKMLDLLDELGSADNTFVMYSTDNGPNTNAWQNGATYSFRNEFRNEKNSKLEGVSRIPALFRWSGHIKPGTVLNGIMSHLDMFPTIVSIAGEPDIKEKLEKGMNADGTNFKAHLGGLDLSKYLTGEIVKISRSDYCN